MKKLNKTVAKFKYRGKKYEIDWLTDADFADGYKEYDIFEGSGAEANLVGHISSKTNVKQILITLAKIEIRENDNEL